MLVFGNLANKKARHDHMTDLDIRLSQHLFFSFQANVDPQNFIFHFNILFSYFTNMVNF